MKTENNKLIADFMSFKKVRSSNKIKDYYLPSDLWFYDDDYKNSGKTFDFEEIVKECYPEQMKFKTSWDWLMLVVEKIEMIIEKDDTFYNFIIAGGCNCYIISSEGKELISSDKGKSKLECTYDACIEFIKWYNQNK